MHVCTDGEGAIVAHEDETVDISKMPDVLRLAEAVHESNSPRILRRDDTEIAILMPLPSGKRRRGKRAKTAADCEAFRAAAGSWKDVDIEAFKDYIRDRHDASRRPPVEF
jgi:hypothetical protein